MSDDLTGETPETPDMASMSEADLRALHADLTAQIDGLLEQPLTPALALEINALKEQRNDTVRAVNTIVSYVPVEDVEITAAVETPTPAIEAPADEAPDTTLETVVTESENPADTPNDEVVAAAEEILTGIGERELAMTAATERPTAPTVVVRPRVAWVAGAGQRQYTQGTELDNESLARAWDSQRNLRPGPDGAPERAIVANLPAFEDVDDFKSRMLSGSNSVHVNDSRISEAVDAWKAKRSGAPMSAQVAAICEPLDIIREIPDCGETDTPFTDSFPSAPVGRLGFTFTRASSAASVDGAITLWTDTDQDAIDESDPDTWKPCIPITCSSPVTVTAQEFITCVTVDSATEMSSPERVKEFMNKVRVQRSRRREQVQLTKFDATASGFSYTAHDGYGTIPSLVQAIETMMPQLAYPERLDETDWDIFIEPGLVQKLTIDRHNVGNPVEVAAARAETMAWLRKYLGRNVIELRDFKGANPFQTAPAAGSSATLEELPDTDRIRFVPTGAYIYGSTGEESTGWQTDGQLVRQNRKQAFTAEWFLLAKHGCHPASYIDLTSTPDGGRAGLVAPYGFSGSGS